MIELRALSLTDMEPIRAWRNSALETLRTPYRNTKEQQEDWYYKEIANRESHTRYWGLWSHYKFIGYGGIENIEWENGRGEISLLISPDCRGLGFGRKAVELFLDQAFNYLRLESVWGEVYHCGHVDFWKKICTAHKAEIVDLPMVKYYNGVLYGAMRFCFIREDYK